MGRAGATRKKEIQSLLENFFNIFFGPQNIIVCVKLI